MSGTAIADSATNMYILFFITIFLALALERVSSGGECDVQIIEIGRRFSTTVGEEGGGHILVHRRRYNPSDSVRIKSKQEMDELLAADTSAKNPVEAIEEESEIETSDKSLKFQPRSEEEKGELPTVQDFSMQAFHIDSEEIFGDPDEAEEVFVEMPFESELILDEVAFVNTSDTPVLESENVNLGVSEDVERVSTEATGVSEVVVLREDEDEAVAAKELDIDALDIDSEDILEEPRSRRRDHQRPPRRRVVIRKRKSTSKAHFIFVSKSFNSATNRSRRNHRHLPSDPCPAWKTWHPWRRV